MNLILAILIVFNVVALIAIASLIYSNIKLWIDLEAMKSSTHQVTYIDPLQQHFQKPSEDEEEKIQNFQTDLDDIG